MNPAFLRDLRWAHAEFNRHGSQRPTRQLRFLLRSLLTARTSQAWFAALRELGLPSWTVKAAEWLQQPHRPFFDHRLDVAEVARLLVHDLRTSVALFGPDRLSTLVAGRCWPLATVQGRTSPYTLVLRKEMQFSKEGTLSLCLLREDGVVLQRLVFSLAPAPGGQRHLLIGCVQSVNEDTVNALRAATKDLNGIQPRLLLLRALRGLARHLGCEGVQAVSVQNHVYRSRRYLSRGKVLPDYDELWRLAGGTLRADGNFDLPLEVVDKPLEDVPSHKRAEYRRRHELTETMQAQMAQALA